MSDEIIREVYIDTRFDSYRNFFSDDWGERIDALTADIPKLSPLVFDVMMEWRAAAYTASLPVSILEHMKAFHDGFVRTGEINTTLLRLMEIVPGALARKIPELTTDPSLMRRIQKELVEIGATMEENRDPSGFEFPLEETWNSYLNEYAYQLSLWGSQRICYVSIYNSYENFLVRCVGIAKNIEGCRTTHKKFKKCIVDCFGKEMRDKCWTGPQVNIARLARHALSHAGGRETKRLAQQNHGFVVIDARIQVTPEKTKDLFALLKDAVFALCERAVIMPEFQ